MSLPAVTSDQALRVARVDAVRAYKGPSPFRIDIRLEADGWHADFEHTDPDVQSGGPHYVVSADTGDIVSKKYLP